MANKKSTKKKTTTSKKVTTKKTTSSKKVDTKKIKIVPNKITVYLLIVSLLLSLSLILGLSYAVFQIDVTQSQANEIEVGCFTIDFEDSGTSNTYTNLSLTNSYPISTQTALSKTPYTFKITNTCDYIARATIAINVLNTSTISSLAQSQNKEIGDMLFVAIKEGNNSVSAPVQLSSLEEGTIRANDTDTDVSYILKTDFLEKNQPKNYSIWMWVPEEINGVEVGNEAQNLTLYSKVDVYSQAISGAQTVTGEHVAYISNGQNAQLRDLTITGGTSNNTNVGQDGTMDIVVSGKNLFNYEMLSTVTHNGLTIANNNDGSFTFSGSKTDITVSQGNARPVSHSKSVNMFSLYGNYYITMYNCSTNENAYIQPFFFANLSYNGNTYYSPIHSNNPSYRTYNFTSEIVNASDFYLEGLGFWIGSNASVTTGTYCPQLEYGSAATSFEPYKERRYTIELKDTSNNTISGLSEDDTLMKVNDTWVIDDGTNQVELATATQNVLNSISTYDGISRIWVDDDVLINDISATYLS